jgi:hypothetical protein
MCRDEFQAMSLHVASKFGEAVTVGGTGLRDLRDLDTKGSRINKLDKPEKFGYL